MNHYQRTNCSFKDPIIDEVPEFLNVTGVSAFLSNEQTQSITVTSKVAWTAMDDADWIWITPTSGSNNVIISVTVDANTTDTDRTGIITVANDNISRDITIAQAAPGGNLGVLDPNKAPSENFDLFIYLESKYPRR